MNAPCWRINPDLLGTRKCPPPLCFPRYEPTLRGPHSLVMRHPQRGHPGCEKHRRPYHPHGVDRHVIVRNHPPHRRTLRHNHQPRHNEKPAFKPRQPTHGMKFRVHVPKLHPPQPARCAPASLRCARFDLTADPSKAATRRFTAWQCELVCARAFPHPSRARGPPPHPSSLNQSTIPSAAHAPTP